MKSRKLLDSQNRMALGLGSNISVDATPALRPSGLDETTYNLPTAEVSLLSYLGISRPFKLAAGFLGSFFQEDQNSDLSTDIGDDGDRIAEDES